MISKKKKTKTHDLYILMIAQREQQQHIIPSVVLSEIIINTLILDVFQY